MDIDDLRKRLRDERTSDDLCNLPEDFPETTTALLHDLRQERDSLAGELNNPHEDPRVQQLSHDIKTAERALEKIYNNRQRKILKLASLQSSGHNIDDSHCFPEERDLLTKLVTILREYREEVLDESDSHRD